MQENSALGRVLELVRDLRARCPWDRVQTRSTLRPYLVEEALELDEALGNDDPTQIREEVGDLLLHLAWQFVLAEERDEFTPDEAADGLIAKMRRRHPHLYDLGPRERWETLKRRETPRAVLDGLPATLPPLLMAYRLQQKAASVGFDWPDAEGPAAKVREELAEVEAELAAAAPAPEHADTGAERDAADPVVEELGDLLFAVVNLARKARVQPTVALDRANRKFRARFAGVERLAAARGVDVATAGLEVLDGLWEEVKAG
ncbi:MAG TPA: nucleoside triphosphate pyrophosphohydrolase, partial [Gemmatimonadales bacterium]|nr:nucleoside triphosphate pyrophosphohydrolase [Gemmatimonadales bacterium]